MSSTFFTLLKVVSKTNQKAKTVSDFRRINRISSNGGTHFASSITSNRNTNATEYWAIVFRADILLAVGFLHLFNLQLASHERKLLEHTTPVACAAGVCGV